MADCWHTWRQSYLALKYQFPGAKCVRRLLYAESAREAGAELPQLRRWIGIVTVAIIVVILVGMSAYFCAHVPVVLWEATAGLVLGSLTLRLLSRMV
jgi:hypothetical protein